jgi:hypothetical protein
LGKIIGVLHEIHDTWEEFIENILGARPIVPRIILKIDSAIVLDNTKRGKPTWQPTSVSHNGKSERNW